MLETLDSLLKAPTKIQIHLDTQLNEPINQNSIKVPKVVKTLWGLV